MDAISDDLEIQVGENDLSERVVLMSRQYGVEPQQLIQLLQQNNQLPAIYADVRRGLAVAAVVEAATVTDTDGNVVDTSEFFGSAGDSDSEPADEPADEPAGEDE
jgi:trigger factor